MTVNAAGQVESKDAVGEPGEQQELNGEQAPNGEQSPAGESPSTGEQSPEGDLGFPANTALVDMTETQRTAYWRHEKSKQQRKFEDAERDRKALEQRIAEFERDALSESERAAQDAAAAARAEAIAEARRELLPERVIAELRARGWTVEEATERVEFIDLSKLIDEQGGIVADRLDKIAPAREHRQVQQSPAWMFQQAGGTSTGQKTTLSAAAISERAEEIKNKHK